VDYPTIIFSSNKLWKSSLWLNFNYFKWYGKYCHDVVAFLYLINYVISYVLGKWVPLYVLVKGVGILQSFWDYKALQIWIGHWTFKGLNFEFLLNFFLLFMLMVTWGLPKNGSFGEIDDICRYTFWSKAQKD
jgi:hypothetical protein